MIVRESNGIVLVCTICEDKHAVRRSVANNPELMALEAERIEEDHRECEKYAHDLPRARRERRLRHQWNKLQRLQRRAA